jgi:hypothetical protein
MCVARSCWLAVVATAVGVSLASCAHHAPKVSRASNVDSLYAKRLNDRLAQYDQAAADLDAALARDVGAGSGSTQPVQAPASTAAPQNADIPDEVSRAAEAHARAGVLRRFLNEAATPGQFGLMSSWLQEQGTELARFSADADAHATALQQDAANNPHSSELGARFYNLIVERGAERGAAEELITISNDLQGYQQDYTGAVAADEQQRQNRIKLLSAFLSAPRVHIQAPSFQPPSITTCITAGIALNCVTTH